MYLQDGNVVEVEIELIGYLRTPVKQAGDNERKERAQRRA